MSVEPRTTGSCKRLTFEIAEISLTRAFGGADRIRTRDPPVRPSHLATSRRSGWWMCGKTRHRSAPLVEVEHLDELLHHLVSVAPGPFEEWRHLGLPAIVHFLF